VAISAAVSTAATGLGGLAPRAPAAASATASAAAVVENRMRAVMLRCRKQFDKGGATLE
jgi:hypothetical protein